jgi:coenzyme PQQ precursor peptide PqqA
LKRLDYGLLSFQGVTYLSPGQFWRITGTTCAREFRCSPKCGQEDLSDIADRKEGKEGGDWSMAWVKPEFKEVRMDAEINSYILVLE